MSRLVIPIIGQTLWATGDVRLSIELALLLKDSVGGWKKEFVRVDTATGAFRWRNANCMSARYLADHFAILPTCHGVRPRPLRLSDVFHFNFPAPLPATKKTA